MYALGGELEDVETRLVLDGDSRGGGGGGGESEVKRSSWSGNGKRTSTLVQPSQFGMEHDPRLDEVQSELGGGGEGNHHEYQEIAPMEMESDISDLLDGPSSYGDEWGAVANLDEFFKRLYDYYYQRGFACIVAKRLMNLITLGFTVVFSTFLLGCLNWNELLKCHDEESCKDFEDYIIRFDDHSVGFTMFIVIYFTVFLLYWIWTLLSIIPAIKNGWEMRQFYVHKLEISTRELQTMEWDTVIERIVALQESGKYRVQINSGSLTAKDVALRIMRKRNYMVALINHKVLPVGSSFCGSDWFLGKNLEWMLEVCVLDHLFDDRFALRRDFVHEPWRLRQRFIMWGCLNLLIMPFSLGFMFIYFFLKYAEEFHSKQNYLGPRWWSSHALWEFRDFNELPHFFEKRVCAAVKYADEYIKQFPSPVPTVVASGVSFIAGAFVGVLLLFTLLDESILLFIHLDGRNLLWYIAVLSGVLAIARALVPAVEETVFNPHKAFLRVVAYTHYLPARWRGRTHTYDVRDEFSDFFQYKVVLLMREVLSIVTTPFVLCFVLPRYTIEIVDYVQRNTTYVDGVGDVCIYSLMDVDKHGDPSYGGGLNRIEDSYHTVDGKLEKSWLNFYANHPSWLHQENLQQQQQQDEDQEYDEDGSRRRVGPGDYMSNSDLVSQLSSFQKDKAIASGSASFTTGAQMPTGTSSQIYGSHSRTNEEKGMFHGSNSVMMPLDKVKFANAENYFYWLEEYRDSKAPSNGDVRNSENMV